MKKNLLWIPFREEGNLFLLGKKKNTQLALSSSKFLMLLFDRSARSRNRFCFEAPTSGHNSSVLSFGETGDRDIFSAFIFWSLLQQIHHQLGGGIGEELSQQRGACPEGGLRRSLPC